MNRFQALIITAVTTIIVSCANNLTFALEESTGLPASDVVQHPIVCFTPPSGCGALIAMEISKSADSIYVQAYGFTSSQIAEELVRAHNRGVKVRVLLDKSNISSKHSKMKELVDAGIDIGIDKVSGIAHNKVIIIDERKVITGSFNFTANADLNNAENVIIIEDRVVAANYLQNWFKRKLKNQKYYKTVK